MVEQKITGEKYTIDYEPDTQTVNFEGSLRHMGMNEYQPIEALLTQLLEDNLSQITLNLSQLRLLNSAGIRMLSKFMIQARKKKNVQVIIQGTKNHTWQESSLHNLQRLLPLAKLEWQ